MIIERFGQRMADFVGTTGAKALHAVEEVVPGLEPPRHRAVTPGRALLAAGGAAVAGLASAALRSGALDDVINRVLDSESSSNGSGGSANGRSSGSKPKSAKSKASSTAKKAKDKAADLADKTRTELYEMAKKADIDGRSAMSKDELVKALKKTTSS